MKLKVKAVADNLDVLERLVNDYFYSKSYYIDILKEDKGKMTFIILNRKVDIPDWINEEYKVKYRKGKYYFYRVIDDEDKTK